MPFTISSILNSLALSQRDMILGYADSPIINVMTLCPWGTTGWRNCSLRPFSKWHILYCAVSERQCRGFQVVKQLEWVSDLMRCVINRSAFCLRMKIRTRRKRPDKNCSTWHNCLFSCAHVTQLRNWWKQLTRTKQHEMSCARPLFAKLKVNCSEAFLSILLGTRNKYVLSISTKNLSAMCSTSWDIFDIVTSTSTAGNIVIAGSSYFHKALSKFLNDFYTMNKLCKWKYAILYTLKLPSFHYIINPVRIIIQCGLDRWHIHVNAIKFKIRNMPTIHYGGCLNKTSHS